MTMDNKSRITNSAVILFCKAGYKATTIKNISLKAKVSQGNIYTYYSSKEELFNCLFMDHSPKKPFKEVEGLLTSSKSHRDFIRMLMNLLIDIICKNEVFFKLVMIDITEFCGDHTKKYLREIEDEFSSIQLFQQISLFSTNYTHKDYFRFFIWLLFALGYSDLVFKTTGKEGIKNSMELDLLTYALNNGIGGKK